VFGYFINSEHARVHEVNIPDFNQSESKKLYYHLKNFDKLQNMHGDKINLSTYNIQKPQVVILMLLLMMVICRQEHMMPIHQMISFVKSATNSMEISKCFIDRLENTCLVADHNLILIILMTLNAQLKGYNMCKNKCLCNDFTYGQYLERLKIQKEYSTSLYYAHDYNVKTSGAISHCWGDMLFLASRKKNIVLNKNFGLLWLDLALTVPLDGALTRNKYEGKLLVCQNTTWYLSANLPRLQILYALISSDWSTRGWIAQEVSSAHEIFILIDEGNGVIDLTNEIKNVFGNWFGVIDGLNTLGDLKILNAKEWRYYDDILHTISWWACAEDTSLISIIQKSIIGVLAWNFINNPLPTASVRKNHCWWKKGELIIKIFKGVIYNYGYLTIECSAWLTNISESIEIANDNQNTELISQLRKLYTGKEEIIWLMRDINYFNGQKIANGLIYQKFNEDIIHITSISTLVMLISDSKSHLFKTKTLVIGGTLYFEKHVK
jgi:hypothetical protein